MWLDPQNWIQCDIIGWINVVGSPELDTMLHTRLDQCGGIPRTGYNVTY